MRYRLTGMDLLCVMMIGFAVCWLFGTLVGHTVSRLITQREQPLYAPRSHADATGCCPGPVYPPPPSSPVSEQPLEMS